MADFLYYEDFREGQVFPLGTHALTEAEIIDYAREFDSQPQHMDAEAAKSSMLGGLAASGWFLCALTMRLMVDGLFNRSASRGSPGVDEIQWRRPVFAGDILRLEGHVLGTRDSSRPDRGFVRFRFAVWRGEERVMMFVCSVMFGRKPGA
jgi:acyl dehydratase